MTRLLPVMVLPVMVLPLCRFRTPSVPLVLFMVPPLMVPYKLRVPALAFRVLTKSPPKVPVLSLMVLVESPLAVMVPVLLHAVVAAWKSRVPPPDAVMLPGDVFVRLAVLRVIVFPEVPAVIVPVLPIELKPLTVKLPVGESVP